MNKILTSLIIVMMMFALKAMAQDSQPDKSTEGIRLEVAQNNETTGRHRVPMHINIAAWYNEESKSIDIAYDGEDDGEVYLYMNDNIIGYDSTINTSLQLPASSGLYKIQIIGETWIAQGYVQM
jgi:hypothetical protein